MGKKRRKVRVGALDGLRTLAIFAVMAYHLNLFWLPSGHMGVVIFLVLSGYFATNAILRLYLSKAIRTVTGTLRLWGRRIRRIWPSVLTMVALTATLCAFLNQALLTKMRPDVLPALGFFSNWSYILNDVSYFQRIGGPSPLLHLWYLGVDMQFFIAWSIVLPCALKIGKRFARWFTFVLALASAAWMAWLYVPGADPSRVYYGTDTRAFSMLLGSWLALMLPLGDIPALAKSPFCKALQSGDHGARQLRPTLFARVTAAVSVIGLLAVMALVPANSMIWYYGGMFGVSVVATALIASLLVPKTLTGMLLGSKPMRTLGTRAFALYLWHYPIFLMLGAQKSTTAWWMRVLAVIASLVAAELTYRLVEVPFGPQRKRATAPKESDRTDSTTTVTPKLQPGVVVTAVAVLSCSIYAGNALHTFPQVTLVPAESLVSTGKAADQAIDVSTKRHEATTTATSQKSGDKTTAKKETNTTKKQDKEATADTIQQQSEATQESIDSSQADAQDAPVNESTTPVNQSDDAVEASATDAEKADEPEQSEQAGVTVTDKTVVLAPASETSAGIFDPLLIGDSVPGDAGNEFVSDNGGWEGRLPNALIDTFIGRQPGQALEVLKGYLAQNAVGKVIVLACFSNSTPYPETLEAMISEAGPDRQIFLVGTVNPDGFQDEANANLQAVANAHDNVHYVDWPAVLEGHLQEYLWADDTHLRPEGARVYVDMIVRAVAQAMVDAGGTLA